MVVVWGFVNGGVALSFKKWCRFGEMTVEEDLRDLGFCFKEKIMFIRLKIPLDEREKI